MVGQRFRSPALLSEREEAREREEQLEKTGKPCRAYDREGVEDSGCKEEREEEAAAAAAAAGVAPGVEAALEEDAPSSSGAGSGPKPSTEEKSMPRGKPHSTESM